MMKINPNAFVSGMLTVFFFTFPYYKFFSVLQVAEKVATVQSSLEDLRADQSILVEEIARQLSSIEASLKMLEIISGDTADLSNPWIFAIQYLVVICATIGIYYILLNYSSFAQNFSKILNDYASFMTSENKIGFQSLQKSFFDSITLENKLSPGNEFSELALKKIIEENVENVARLSKSLETCCNRIAELEAKLDILLLDPNVLGANAADVIEGVSQIANTFN